MPAVAEDILRTYGSLKAERQPWEPTWQAIGDTMLPAYNDVTTRYTPGQTRTGRLLDTTGMEGATLLAARLGSDITNFQMRWFDLRMAYEALNTIKAVGVWLDADAKAMQDKLASSTAPKAFSEKYLQFVAFGTGALFLDRNALPDDNGRYGILCRSLPIGTYCIAEDADGRVDTCYRELSLSPRQAIQFWGAKAVHHTVKEAMNHPDLAHKPSAYLHAVYPRSDRDPSREDQQHMAYASCYVDVAHRHVVSEGGYRWFPFCVSRWQKLASWSPWGFGPGHIALPEVLTLNRMDTDVLQALQAYISPPYWTDDPDAAGRVILAPGMINPIAKGAQIQPMRGPGQFDIGKLGMEERRQRVQRIFFMDQLQALPDVNKPGYPTAYEISQRVVIMARLMGPAFMSLLSEFLNPCIDIVFGMMLEAGELPEPPEEVLIAALQGYNTITVDYQGPLARAQKWDEVDAIEGWIASLNAQYQILQDPAIFDVLDRAEANRRSAHVRGVPAAVIRDKEEAARMAQERMQAQQEAQENVELREDVKALGPASQMVRALTPEPQESAA